MHLVVVGSTTGWLKALDRTTGSVGGSAPRWAGRSALRPAPFEDGVVVGTSDGRVSSCWSGRWVGRWTARCRWPGSRDRLRQPGGPSWSLSNPDHWSPWTRDQVTSSGARRSRRTGRRHPFLIDASAAADRQRSRCLVGCGPRDRRGRLRDRAQAACAGQARAAAFGHRISTPAMRAIVARFVVSEGGIRGTALSTRHGVGRCGAPASPAPPRRI